MADQVWFITVPPAQWEHIAYFFMGCLFSGGMMGLAGILHNRFIFKTLPTIIIGLNEEVSKRRRDETK